MGAACCQPHQVIIVPIDPSRVAPQDLGWLTFADAVFWVQHRRERNRELEALVWPDDASDGDREAAVDAVRQLRAALAFGKIEAFGEYAEGSHATIPAVDWATRAVATYEAEWLNTPFVRFRVRRDDVVGLWPAERVKDPVGRPPVWDWALVRSLSLESANDGLGRNKRAEAIEARYREVRGTDTAPAVDTIARKLREWGAD